MPSKTSFFNKGIFLNNIKRFWLITFSYTFFMLLFAISVINSEIVEYTVRNYIPDAAMREIFNQSSEIMTFFPGFYTLVAALAVFSYMHFPKNTAMVHSLPVRRETLFMTNYLSGLSIVAFPLVFSSIVIMIAEAAFRIPNVNDTLIWLGVNLVMTFLLYSFAVFAGMFTGHMAAHAIFFGIFNFLSIFIKGMIDIILRNFVFGYAGFSNSSSLFEVWSPLYHITRLFSGFGRGEGNVSTIIWYAVAGIIFLVSSYFLYRRRQMEVATDVISFKVVKPIFRYSVAFCSAALLGSIIVGIFDIRKDLVGFIAAYLVGGFIGYFASEMFLRKTFRVFRAYKGFVAFGIVLSLLLCSIDFDLYGYERHIPLDSEVELMYVSTGMDYRARLALRPEDYDPDEHRYILGFYDDPPKTLSDAHIKELRELEGFIGNREAITKARQIHDYIVKNKALFRSNENAADDKYASGNPEDCQNRSLYFAYRLKDGTLIERQYNLVLYKNNTELDQLLREYLAIPGVRERYETVLGKTAQDIISVTVHYSTKDGPSNSFEITENIQDFLDAYQKDISENDPLEGLFGNYQEHRYNIDISIEFRDKELSNMRQYSYSRPVYAGYDNTINYLVKKGIIDQDILEKSEALMQ